MAPELALAASARDWPDRIHRHVLDHGGARVVGRVMTAEQALEGGFNVLLIDDVCSFLSPGLVTRLRSSGSEVIGVFFPEDESHAKRRLLECGVSDVIDTEASPREFLDAVDSALEHCRQVTVPALPKPRTGLMVGVTGVTAGVGTTEVAVGLSAALSRDMRPLLIDADVRRPSIAQRLDLPVHPNIRTAIDAVVHGSGDIATTMHGKGKLAVIGGIADWRDPAPVGRSELTMLLDRISEDASVTVADLGAVDDVSSALLSRFDELVLVGLGDPVGVSRLIVALDGLPEDREVVVVANLTPKGSYQRSEIRAALNSGTGRRPVLIVQRDRRLAAKVWEGGTATRGVFSRVMRRMAALVAERVSR